MAAVVRPRNRYITLPVRIRYGIDTGFDIIAFASHSPLKDPESLEFDVELPAVCMRHGVRAVRFKERVITFFREDDGLVQATPREHLRNTPGVFRHGKGRPHGASLHGNWPMCNLCCRRLKVFRSIGAIIVLSGILVIAGILAAFQTGVDGIPIWLGVTLFPGWIPIGLMAAAVLFEASGPYVRVRPISDTSRITVSAHPDFVAAARQAIPLPANQYGEIESLSDVAAAPRWRRWAISTGILRP